MSTAGKKWWRRWWPNLVNGTIIAIIVIIAITINHNCHCQPIEAHLIIGIVMIVNIFTYSTKKTPFKWLSFRLYISSAYKMIQKTMHWSMRTHLANTALQVDDWIKGRNIRIFNIPMFKHSNLLGFECSNIQEEEHFGEKMNLAFLQCAQLECRI